MYNVNTNAMFNKIFINNLCKESFCLNINLNTLYIHKLICL